jgi:hypothetical protein
MANTIKCECLKCGGSGYIAAFAGIANGICFTCVGTGIVEIKAARKQNRFSPINAMHCETLEDAQNYRMEQFSIRFPGLILTEDDQFKIANGCGKIQAIVAKYLVTA